MKKLLKIILLEDSPLDAEMIQRLLKAEKIDCECLVAGNKKSFLAALEEFAPDLIISDHSLPQFNSSLALDIAREKFPGIPFIMVTGTVSEEFAANIIKQGADDYILKDRMARLPAAINNTLLQRKVEKDRKATEQKIIQSEENLKAIFDNSSEGFVLMDENGIIKAFNNKASETILRNIEEQINIGKSIFQFVDADRKSFFGEILARVLVGETIQYDRKYISQEGEINWINFSFNPVRSGLLIKGICATGNDITQRKIAEQQKEFDHNNLHALINNTDDLLWSIDLNYNLITSNDAFDEAVRQVSGVTPVKGSNILDASYNEEQSLKYKAYYERAFKGESFTVIENNKMPLEFWSEISFYPIYEKQLVIGTACFSHDITERKKAEATLQRLEEERLNSKMEEQKMITTAMLHAQEKERTAIGIELHDNVNQILVGSNLMLSMVKNNPGKYQELVNTAMTNIKDAIEENRKIAHVFVSPDLRGETLEGLLYKLAEKMLAPSGVKTTITINDFNDDILSDDHKINLYRIAQEQCTNIIKYANATDVTILLAITTKQFTMSIADNGIGMKEGQKISGIGLRNINGRLSIFNGSSEITSSEGNGFKLSVTIPL